ncbi:MAG: GNAT family N-acetyltransferase [Gaiellaceae bacterium]
MIETERLLLRLPDASDTAALGAAYADPEVMRYIGAGSPWSREEIESAVARMRRAWELDGAGLFILVRRSDGLVLGDAGLLAWDPESWSSGTRSEIGERAEIEIGWTLRRDAWGSGYATEAALAAKRWATQERSQRSLISLIHRDNSRSARVASKLGAHPEREIVTAAGVPAQVWRHEPAPC